jgi:hypothetical protein
MAKIIPFRTETQPIKRKLRYRGSKILNFVPIDRMFVINNGTKSHIAGFPEAWQPFIRWPGAASTNR